MERSGDKFAEYGIEPLAAAIRRGVALPTEVELYRSLHAIVSATDGREPVGSAAAQAAFEGRIERLAASRRRRNRLRELWVGLAPLRILVGVSAVAMLLVLGAGKLWPLFARSGSPAALPLPQVAEARARLTSPGDEPLRFTLANGASVELRGTLDLDQADAKHVYARLIGGEGEVQVSVPHLPAGATLMVGGTHADAIVHGTRFRVEDLGSGGTSVQVFQGLVEVVPRGGNRPPVFLAAGSSLRVPTLDSYLRDVAARIESAAPTGDCRALEGMAEAAVLGSANVDASTALYLRAACAARAGDPTSAIRDFEQAARVSRDPTRSDNALARAAELRQALDPSAGRLAWRAYLTRFPQGLHSGMARRFLASRY